MFRGLVLRVRPSTQQVADLPFQPSKVSVTPSCTEADLHEADSTPTACLCGCCCFTFEITDGASLHKVPGHLWGQPVVWRKIQNPIGIDQAIPSGFPLGVSADSNHVPSRIPGLPASWWNLNSLPSHGGHEVTIDLATGKIEESAGPINELNKTPSKTRVPRLTIMGSGGTGCEILKTLFLRGFHAFTVVDRDTIDLSNLNRQLLFSTDDIGRSKAQAAVELFQHAISQNAFYQSIAPGDSLEAYASEFRYLNGNIESFFTIAHPVPPFSLYGQPSGNAHPEARAMPEDLCYSALDSIPTRKYINRRSYFMGKPIIESGVSGLNGQIQPICVDCGNQCYDCQGIKSSDQANTFAVCTIHAKPTKLVHCVHYAQELYAFVLKVASSAENDANEFDELDGAVRSAFQDASERKNSLCAAIVELFDFICSKRVIRKVDSAGGPDEESNAQEIVGQKRKRDDSGVQPANGPRWTDFAEFVSRFTDGTRTATAVENPLWESSSDQKNALALFMHSIACIAGAVPTVQTGSQQKRIKANFIYAVAFFRCMVFRIPPGDLSRDWASPAEVVEGSAAAAAPVIRSVSDERGLPDAAAMLSFMNFFLEEYKYTRAPLYMHIESTSMRIIPSVSSANAIVGAFAVSMGTKTLFHIHSKDGVVYSSGNRCPVDGCPETTQPAHHCPGEYLRHVHIRSSPMEARNRGSFDLTDFPGSIGGKSQTEGTKRKKAHKMMIYSHPLYRASPDCQTCAPYHQASYSILANVAGLLVGDFIRHVVENIFAVNDPIIDIVLSDCFSAEQQVRTLYEHDEFEQNTCEFLSKWMDLEGNSPLRLTICSSEDSNLRFRTTIYHDVENKLSPGVLIVRRVEPLR